MGLVWCILKSRCLIMRQYSTWESSSSFTGTKENKLLFLTPFEKRFSIVTIWENKIEEIELEYGSKISRINTNLSSKITSIISAGGKYLVASIAAEKIVAWDLDEGVQCHELAVGKGNQIRLLCASKGEKETMIFYVNSIGIPVIHAIYLDCLIDNETRPTLAFKGFPKLCKISCADSSSSFLLAGNEQGNLGVWDFFTTPVFTIKRKKFYLKHSFVFGSSVEGFKAITSICSMEKLSMDQIFIAVGNSEGELELWSLHLIHNQLSRLKKISWKSKRPVSITSICLHPTLPFILAVGTHFQRESHSQGESHSQEESENGCSYSVISDDYSKASNHQDHNPVLMEIENVENQLISLFGMGKDVALSSLSPSKAFMKVLDLPSKIPECLHSLYTTLTPSPYEWSEDLRTDRDYIIYSIQCITGPMKKQEFCLKKYNLIDCSWTTSTVSIPTHTSELHWLRNCNNNGPGDFIMGELVPDELVAAPDNQSLLIAMKILPDKEEMSQQQRCFLLVKGSTIEQHEMALDCCFIENSSKTGYDLLVLQTPWLSFCKNPLDGEILQYPLSHPSFKVYPTPLSATLTTSSMGNIHQTKRQYLVLYAVQEQHDQQLLVLSNSNNYGFHLEARESSSSNSTNKNKIKSTTPTTSFTNECACFQLKKGENLESLQWQNSCSRDSVWIKKNALMLAVLTDRGIYILDSNLQVMIDCISLHGPSPKSFLWLGSSVVYVTHENKVYYLSKQGEHTSKFLCYLKGDKIMNSSQLVGLLPGKLYYSSGNKNKEIHVRYFNVIEPLIAGFLDRSLNEQVDLETKKALSSIGLKYSDESNVIGKDFLRMLLDKDLYELSYQLTILNNKSSNFKKVAYLSNGLLATICLSCQDWETALFCLLKDDISLQEYCLGTSEEVAQLLSIESKLFDNLSRLVNIYFTFGQFNLTQKCLDILGKDKHLYQLAISCGKHGKHLRENLTRGNHQSHLNEMWMKHFQFQERRDTLLPSSCVLPSFKTSTDINKYLLQFQQLKQTPQQPKSLQMRQLNMEELTSYIGSEKPVWEDYVEEQLPKESLGPFIDDEDAIVGYWRLEQQEDATLAYDISKRGSHGIILEGEWIKATAPVDRGDETKVKEASAIRLNDTTNIHPKYNCICGIIFTIPQDHPLDLGLPYKLDVYRRCFTLEFWIKKDEQLQNISSNPVLACRRSIWTLSLTDNALCFTIEDGLHFPKLVGKTKNLTLDEWTHFAVTFESQDIGKAIIHLYVNGILDAKDELNYPTNAFQPPSSESVFLLAPDRRKHCLYEIRLWAKSRNEDQIRDMHLHHLNMAVSKKKLAVTIHPLDCKCEKCMIYKTNINFCFPATPQTTSGPVKNRRIVKTVQK